MKKIGQFFLTFLPIIITTILQYLAVFFLMGITTLIAASWHTFVDKKDLFTIFSNLEKLWMDSEFNAYLMIFYSAMALVLFGLCYSIRYGGNYRPNLKETFHPLTICGVVMLTPGMQYLSTYIIAITATFFPDWLKEYEKIMEAAGLNDTMTLGLFLYSVIFAPLSEELIFRGVTLRQARLALPFWAANILQAALFGIFHMNMIQGIYAFFLGLILGFICERGGSIYHSILLHMLFNLWAAVMSRFLTIGDSNFEVIFWFIFGLVMTIGGLLIFTRGAKKCNYISMSNSSLPDNPPEMQ